MSANPPNPDTTTQRRNRKVLILLMLVALAPVVLAYSLYLSGWRPHGKSLQHGELLNPARALPEVMLRSADGSMQPLSSLRRHWLLLSVGSLPCVGECLARLDTLQRLRLAQGKEMRRVQIVFVVLNGTHAEQVAFAGTHPGLHVYGGERAALAPLVRALGDATDSDAGTSQRLYLIDPVGNLVLRYGPDADPRGIHKDLARLLRLSQIG
jgi:cytochrome oxidase Cu insertion factor (SCO1/SenC/PrrC family)